MHDDDGEIVGFVHRLADDSRAGRCSHALSRSNAAARRGAGDRRHRQLGAGPRAPTSSPGPTSCTACSASTPSGSPPTYEAFLDFVDADDRRRRAGAVRPPSDGRRRVSSGLPGSSAADGAMRWCGAAAGAERWTTASRSGSAAPIQDITDSRRPSSSSSTPSSLNAMMQAGGQRRQRGHRPSSRRCDRAAERCSPTTTGHARVAFSSPDARRRPSWTRSRSPATVPTAQPDRTCEREVAETGCSPRGPVFEERDAPTAPSLGFPVRHGGDVAWSSWCSPPAAPPTPRDAALDGRPDRGPAGPGGRAGAGRRRAGRGPRRRDGGVAAQVGVPGDDEPRDPDPDERRHRAQRPAAAHRARRPAATPGAGRPGGRATLLAASSTTSSTSPRSRPASWSSRSVDFERPRRSSSRCRSILLEPARDKGLDLPRRRGPTRCRRGCVGDPHAARPGAHQPRLERGQVHRQPVDGHGSAVGPSRTGAGATSCSASRSPTPASGIAGDAQQRLFEPFRQADASTTRTLRRHRARAGHLPPAGRTPWAARSACTASRASAARFWFTSRFDAASEHRPRSVAAGRQADRPPGRRRRGHVLVVEDNDVNQLVASAAGERSATPPTSPSTARRRSPRRRRRRTTAS